MSYHPGTPTSGLRYREDTGIELRCNECPPGLRYWPLTREFWDFEQTFRRCRACRDKSKHASEKRRRQDPAFRLAIAEYQRKYRKEAAGARRVKQQLAYWSDPEKHRARARERYYAKRDEILTQKRVAYWAQKAA